MTKDDSSALPPVGDIQNNKENDCSDLTREERGPSTASGKRRLWQPLSLDPSLHLIYSLSKYWKG